MPPKEQTPISNQMKSTPPQSDEHSFNPSHIFVLVVVAIVAVVVFTDWFVINDKSNDAWTEFTPQYVERHNNIEVPGTFPVDLMSQEGFVVENGSFFESNENNMQQYAYRVATATDPDVLFEYIQDVLSDGGFTILNTIESARMVNAERVSSGVGGEYISVLVNPTASRTGVLEISYQVGN